MVVFSAKLRFASRALFAYRQESSALIQLKLGVDFRLESADGVRKGVVLGGSLRFENF
jgi:hypothetical protein